MPIENYRVPRPHEPELYEDTDDDLDTYQHPLDAPDKLALRDKLQDWWDEAREAQAQNRLEQALDEDFYDGLQWKDDDISEMVERGQAPLVYNIIKQSIDWIIGTERRTRVDFQVYPRGGEDQQGAETKTALLKYNSDVNRVPFHRSRAFKESVVSGVGWLEDGARNDETDEVTYSRSESWRNVWYDHLAREPDLSDARYLFRQRWVDLDVALAMFPDRADVLRSAAIAHNLFGNDDDEFFYSSYYTERDDQGRVKSVYNHFSDDTFNTNERRSRVRLIECWYRVPANVQIMRGAEPFNGLDYDDSNPMMNRARQEEIISTFDAVVMRVRLCIMTDDALLFEGPTPYRHQKFPMTPVWGYRRGRDGTPYGAVRNARDPQEDLNKRLSKALHILSTRRVVADEDAVDSPEKWREIEDELARPDSIIKLSKPNARFEVDSDRDIAEGHLRLMEHDREFVRSSTGVTGENLAEQTNAVSGKAIRAKQEEGSMVTAELFDNLRLAVQIQGEKQLSIMEQYLGHQKVIRLVGDKGKAEFMTVNEQRTDPATGQMEVLNDITASKADFVVDQRDYRESVRQAMFESMMDLLGRLDPQVGLQLLDLVVEMSDVPGRDQIVARIRQINGQPDPDAADDPQAQAEIEAQRQQQQREADLVERERMAKVGKDEASARNLDAKTGQARLEVIGKAIDTGKALAKSPEVAGAADELAMSAGAVS